MRRKLWLVLWTLLVTASVLASAEDVEKALNDRYKDKILILRRPVTGGHINVDATADLKDKKSDAPWTLYGRIQVRNFRIEKDRLELNGKRVVYFFDPKKNQLMPRKSDQKLTVRIRLQKPLGSIAEATALLGTVFALTPEDVVSSAPEYWRHYLEVQVGLVSADAKGEKPPKTPAEDFRKKTQSEGEPVFPVGEGVLPPRIRYQPTPEFSEAARASQFQGLVGFNVIVDRRGTVGKIQIVRPAGMGLDEKALEGIRLWRFQPATRNGEPVAVVVYIEVDFKLYH